jgi:exopolysaccharide production protein ExoQ
VKDPAVVAFGAPAGQGDLIRQLCYLVVFAVIVLGAAQKHGLQMLRAVPILLALLLAWCVASALWAGEPAVTFRRAGLEVVIALATLLSVDAIGAERCLKLLRYVLIAILAVNWISIPLIAQAVHLSGEADPGLVGDWRGLYGHKNIAGSVCAMSAFVFLYFAVEQRKRVDILLFVAAVAFLIMTRSKASLGLFPAALALGLVYRLGWRSGLDRTIVTVAGALIAVFAIVYLVMDSGAIARLLEDPGEFTGRAEIWQAEIAYIADHPLLGSGFGTFADTGAISPLHSYVGNSWVGNVSHGHNGYLQLLVTIGGVGFVLAMLGLVIQPAIAFWRQGDIAIGFKSLLFALFVFVILHNILESDFLEGDGVTWVGFLLVIGMLRTQVTASPSWRAR